MNEWQRVTLRDVATIERSSIQPEQIVSGTTYVGLEHIDSGGTFLGLAPVDAGVLASSKFRFDDGHILYGKLRPYLNKVACPNFAGVCSTDILPIRPTTKADRRFLYHYLRQPTIVAWAHSHSVGVNLPRLTASVLEQLDVPLPPLEVQRRIAEVLDRADALRAKRRAALAHLDALSESIFLEMFGQPISNSRGLAVRPLKELIDPRRPITYGILKPGPISRRESRTSVWWT